MIFNLRHRVRASSKSTCDANYILTSFWSFYETKAFDLFDLIDLIKGFSFVCSLSNLSRVVVCFLFLVQQLICPIESLIFVDS